MPLTKQQLATYRSTSERRVAQRRRQLDHHRERAWRAVRGAAELLRERFGATRVVVFGSVICEECFTIWSDVDIAAWGIAPEETFCAMGATRELDREIEVNLIDIAACRPAIRKSIERHGVDV